MTDHPHQWPSAETPPTDASEALRARLQDACQRAGRARRRRRSAVTGASVLALTLIAWAVIQPHQQPGTPPMTDGQTPLAIESPVAARVTTTPEPSEPARTTMLVVRRTGTAPVAVVRTSDRMPAGVRLIDDAELLDLTNRTGRNYGLVRTAGRAVLADNTRTSDAPGGEPDSEDSQSRLRTRRDSV